MANWQDIFNQIQNTKTFQPLGNNAVQFDTPVNPIGSATQSSTPASSDTGTGSPFSDLGKGFLGVGTSLGDVGKGLLDGLVKTGNSSLALWNDLNAGGRQAVDEWNNPNVTNPGSAMLGDLGNMLGNIKTDIGNVWSGNVDQSNDTVRNTFQNAYNGTPMGNKFAENAQLYGMPFFDPIPGAAIGGLLKGGAEVAGRIPGIADRIEQATAKQAGKAFDSAYPEMPVPQPPGLMTDDQINKMLSGQEVPSLADMLNGMGKGEPPIYGKEMGNAAEGEVPSLADMLNQINKNNETIPADLNMRLRGPQSAQYLIDNYNNYAKWLNTPPMQNGKQLASWLAEQGPKIGLDFGEGDLRDLAKTSEGYRTLQSWAQEIYPEISQFEARNMAASNGHDLDALMNGAKQSMNDLRPDTTITRDQLAQLTGRGTDSGLGSSELDAFVNGGRNVPKESINNPLEATGQPTANIAENAPDNLLSSLLGPKPINTIGDINSVNKAKIPENFLSDLAKMDIPGAVAKNEARSVYRQAAIDAANGMSPGDKLSYVLNNAIKQNVGDRLTNALYAMGVGSGIDKLPESMRNAFLNNRGQLGEGKDTLTQFFKDYASTAANSGMTADRLKVARDALEAGKFDSITDPEAASIIKKLQDFTMNGAAGIHSGLQAELASKLLDNTQLLNNYLHMSIDPKSGPLLERFLGQQIADQTAKKTITQGYAKERKFASAAAAEQAGYKVRDPISSTLDRLLESHQDLMNQKLFQELKDLGMAHGLVSERPTAGLQKFTSANGSVNPLHGMYLSDPVARLANGIERVPFAMRSGLGGTVARGWDRMTNLYKLLNLYNPLVHNHNTFANALMSFGLDPAHYANAEATLGTRTGKMLGGSATPEMQQSLEWAKRTGALGNEYTPSAFTDIERTLNGGSLGLKYKIGQGINAIQEHGLWNREEALRLGVFHQAFQAGMEKGLPAEQAANAARDTVNKYMVDYSNHNLSTIEKELFTRLDPFYKWHKGNYALQAANYGDTNALMRIANFNKARSGLNEYLTGHPQDQNIGDNKQKNINVQMPTGKGNFSFDLYSPTDDLQKMLGETLGSFAWNHTVPQVKEGVDQIANRQFYPFGWTAPEEKQHLANLPITRATDSNSDAMMERLNHMFGTFAPSYAQGAKEAMMGSNSQNPAPMIDQFLVNLLGGFSSPSLVTPQSVGASKAAEMKFLQQEMRKSMQQQMRKGN